MLSEKVIALLAALPYRADADWSVNILPFGSIYWNDEMPAIAELVDTPEQMLIVHAMFGMRLKIWDGETLDPQARQLWDGVRGQVPNWALFQRLSLSDEQKLARAEAEKQVEQAFE